MYIFLKERLKDFSIDFECGCIKAYICRNGSNNFQLLTHQCMLSQSNLFT